MLMAMDDDSAYLTHSEGLVEVEQPSQDKQNPAEDEMEVKVGGEIGEKGEHKRDDPNMAFE